MPQDTLPSPQTGTLLDRYVELDALTQRLDRASSEPELLHIVADALPDLFAPAGGQLQIMQTFGRQDYPDIAWGEGDGSTEVPRHCAQLATGDEIVGALTTVYHPAFGEHLASFTGAVALRVAIGISHHRARQAATHTTTRDPLTGLLHRHHFDESLERELARSRRIQRNMALLVVDIDGFQSFNDQYGQLVGDAMLKAVAEATRRSFRRSDLICRSGEDEFMILMPEAELPNGMMRAERLRDLLSTQRVPVRHDKSDPVTVSIGVVATEGHEQWGQDLIVRVYDALELAKADGGHTVRSRVDDDSLVEVD